MDLSLADQKCEVCGAQATQMYRDSIEHAPIRDAMERMVPKLDAFGRKVRDRFGDVVMEPLWWEQMRPGPCCYRCDEHKTEGREIFLDPKQRANLILAALRKAS